MDALDKILFIITGIQRLVDILVKLEVIPADEPAPPEDPTEAAMITDLKGFDFGGSGTGGFMAQIAKSLAKYIPKPTADEPRCPLFKKPCPRVAAVSAPASASKTEAGGSFDAMFSPEQGEAPCGPASAS